VDETGSRLYPIMGFGVSDVDPLGSIIERLLVLGLSKSSLFSGCPRRSASDGGNIESFS
jgi:hypothetical protein